MSMSTVTEGKVSWINIEHPSHDDIEHLRRYYPFHPLDLEDCLSDIERPKVDEYENYLFIVMHYPIYDLNKQVSRFSEVDVFIGSGYLITLHHGELPPLIQLFEECQKDERARIRHMSKGAGQLLYGILDRTVDYEMRILTKVGGRIGQVEGRIFTEDMRYIVEEISIIRRDVIALRRIIKPQIAVISNLERKDRPFIREGMEVYFGDIVDGFSRAWDELEDHREVIESLSATSESITSYRINETMRALTVISVLLLPLTLLAGIYGMNVPLPFMKHPYVFWGIVVVMLATIVSLLLFFRRRKWV
ncbi:MAG: magnesium/cobalt transporter CorA [Anaerolineae bacterium]|jgi:magnesium transporter|nr:magnesium/cobalt transporter CorA [Anaerolineae bacterium]